LFLGLPRLLISSFASTLTSSTFTYSLSLHDALPIFRAAIVGCGRIAQRHARILASFLDVEMVAMVDSAPAVAERFASAHGGRPYSDLASMVEKERPDLVAVCAPSGAHAGITLDLVRLGVGNIVVE